MCIENKFTENMQIYRKYANLQKIYKFVENMQICRKYANLQKMCKFVESKFTENV